MPRRRFLAVAATASSTLALGAGARGAAGGGTPTLLSVKRIWSAKDAMRARFTGLVHFKDRWYVAFRESGVVLPEPGPTSANHGAVRVISSADGEQWESVAFFAKAGHDLRDPKITATPDGRLMAYCLTPNLAWFSGDGRRWSDAHEFLPREERFWRVDWHQGVAYTVNSMSAEGGKTRPLRLYRSDPKKTGWDVEDGIPFDVVCADMLPRGYPDGTTPETAKIRMVEPSLVFRPDGTCVALVRRQDDVRGVGTIGIVGTAKPPYTDWNWKILNQEIGAPHMIQLPDGRFVAGVRLYRPLPKDAPGGRRTALVWVDPEKGRVEEFLTLPSGNHTSYAGLVYRDGILWVSYYSAHESKVYDFTSIYLAKVRVN